VQGGGGPAGEMPYISNASLVVVNERRKHGNSSTQVAKLLSTSYGTLTPQRCQRALMSPLISRLFQHAV